MKNLIIHKIFYSILFLLSLTVLKASNPNDYAALLKEGKKQYAELLKYNAENARNGQTEKNWYIFSLLPDQNWLEINKNISQDQNINGSNGVWVEDYNNYLVSNNDVLQAYNSALQDFNTNNSQNVQLYICISSGIKIVLPSVTTQDFQDHAYAYANGDTQKNIYSYLRYTHTGDKDWSGFIAEDSEILTKLKNVMVKILNSPVGDNKYDIPKDSNRVVMGVSVFNASYENQDNEIDLGDYFYSKAYSAKDSYIAGCNESLTTYMRNVSSRATDGTTTVQKKISHYINSLKEFVDYEICQDEDCSYLIQPGGAYENHPYANDDGPLGIAVRGNPCILLTLEHIGVFDGGGGLDGYAGEFADICAVLLSAGFLPAILSAIGASSAGELIPLIAAEMEALETQKCVAGASIAYYLLISINHFFLDQEFPQALAVNPLEIVAACLESMVENPAAATAASAAFSCVIGGISHSANEDSYDDIQLEQFSNEACLKSAFVAVLVQGLLRNSGPVARKLATLSDIQFLKGCIKMGIPYEYLYSIFSKFKWAINSAGKLKTVLKITDDQANQIWNNPVLRDEILNSGIFAKFKIGSFTDLPPQLRADILTLFEDADHGIHILRKFNDNFDDFVAVYKKAKSQIDGLDDISKKRALFDDLDGNVELINAIRGNAELVNGWEVLHSVGSSLTRNEEYVQKPILLKLSQGNSPTVYAKLGELVDGTGSEAQFLNDFGDISDWGISKLENGNIHFVDYWRNNKNLLKGYVIFDPKIWPTSSSLPIGTKRTLVEYSESLGDVHVPSNVPHGQPVSDIDKTIVAFGKYDGQRFSL